MLARSLASLAFLALLTTAANAAIPTQIKTAQGIVEGEASTDPSILTYKGIPYAAPPIGKLRWSPPAPAEPWNGIRSARDFGYHCVQTNAFADMAFHDPGQSEDCLTLNIWTPANAAPGKLPVMVWIYGGGFTAGASSENRHNGISLAKHGVVLVTLNYRLGIFGFFAHPELTAESANHASGNYGLMDQAAAIKWVKDNIAAFGGDPSNITIFGESAGSMSVSSQMASPVSRGTFQKAIGESGGALGGSALPMPTRQQAETANTAFALSAYGTTKLADLRRLPTEDIMRGVTSKGSLARFSAIVDGYFFPKSPAEIYAAGEQAHVPLIAGWNANEGRADSPFTVEGFQTLAKRDFPNDSEAFLKVYKAGTPAEALASAGDYAGDKFIAYSTWRWLEAHVKTGQQPVYRYYFSLPNPGDRFHTPAAGAFHSDDIEYVFGALHLRPDVVLRPEDTTLSEQMQSYWTNFAKTGDPNGSGLPKWPAYTSKDWQVMHLDKTTAAKPDAHRDRYLFLDSTWGKK